MGYAVGSLFRLAELLQLGDGSVGRRVMDLGSQDVTIFDESDVENLNAFVRRFSGDPAARLSVPAGDFPKSLAARELFSAAGFDYICCDVDRRPGTLYVDFNTLQFDTAQYDQFDLVLNAGTTEHLPNPVAAFFLMHHLCRPGGILFHEVPLSGWFNHGLVNLTPKFWHTLRWMNSYEVLSARVKVVRSDAADQGNFGGSHLDFIENLGDAGPVSSSIEIVYRKGADRGFVPPFDAVIPTNDGGEATAKLVWGSLAPFVACGALTGAAAVASVNAFLAFQQLPYRITDERSGKGSMPAFLGLTLKLASALPRSVRQARQLRGIKKYVLRKLSSY